ncbi:DUF3619 family protein [Rhodocyclus purpureus]|uniref:DUF3619 family protein n=1 Tax=Rhodocyclus purpureus TaxID=1067 RepID=UPI001911C670|nr:DUF3619 family protein [Rhodocyclus purpureus]MBK5912911.1 hypothetical protein [Rhodocyclus purpureus]
MNESEELQFARQLRLRLNRGLHELPPETGECLRAARERALERQRVIVRHSRLASVGDYFHSHFDRFHIDQILIAVLLALGIALTTYWNAEQSVAEMEEIDSALLADDLPVEALTDQGFATWLKDSSTEQ